MAIVRLDGTLIAGPPTCAGLGVFPSISIQDQITLLQNPKPASVATGILQQPITSPGAFVALVGISATGPVTAADTLYFKCDGQVQLELTNDDGTGVGTTVAVIPVQGLLVLEFPAPNRLKGLRIKGTSRIVYFGSGPL